LFDSIDCLREKKGEIQVFTRTGQCARILDIAPERIPLSLFGTKTLFGAAWLGHNRLTIPNQEEK
jgi:hypothetical protein